MDSRRVSFSRLDCPSPGPPRPSLHTQRVPSHLPHPDCALQSTGQVEGAAERLCASAVLARGSRKSARQKAMPPATSHVVGEPTSALLRLVMSPPMPGRSSGGSKGRRAVGCEEQARGMSAGIVVNASLAPMRHTRS